MPEHQQMQKPGKPDSTFQKQAALTIQNPVSHPSSIIQRARIDPKSLTAADVLQLQRTIGNRAVGRLLSEIRNPSKVQQATIQRQEVPEDEKEPLQGMFGKEPEEETCPSCVQRQEKPEEEEPLQGKFETIQKQEPEEEEKLQMKSVVQRQEIPEEEEPLQGKMVEPVQRQEIPEEDEPIQGKMTGTIQRQEIPEEEPLQKKSENNTGMPDNLKAGVENLSGINMSDVRVHYSSDKPAKVGALAYTQGTNIHVAPGQERHLPHEAWHVVQQAQGRVQPTLQMNDVAVNDDVGLEREADEMGEKAIQTKENWKTQEISVPMCLLVKNETSGLAKSKFSDYTVVQRAIDRDSKPGTRIIITNTSEPFYLAKGKTTGEVQRYDSGDSGDFFPVEFDIKPRKPYNVPINDMVEYDGSKKYYTEEDDKKNRPITGVPSLIMFLDEEKINYCFAGSVALKFWADYFGLEFREPQDMDIIVDNGDFFNVWYKLCSYQGRGDDRDCPSDNPKRPTRMKRAKLNMFNLDILNNAAFDGLSSKVTINNVPIIGIEELLKLKTASSEEEGRQKDLHDIEIINKIIGIMKSPK